VKASGALAAEIRDLSLHGSIVVDWRGFEPLTSRVLRDRKDKPFGLCKSCEAGVTTAELPALHFLRYTRLTVFPLHLIVSFRLRERKTDFLSRFTCCQRMGILSFLYLLRSYWSICLCLNKSKHKLKKSSRMLFDGIPVSRAGSSAWTLQHPV
jgi:hypothetical protein